jgi:hypothetical protein
MMSRITLTLAPMIIASTLFAQPATARTGRGALRGAADGALIRWLASGGRGAAIGALVEAGTGALIASQGRRSALAIFRRTVPVLAA